MSPHPSAPQNLTDLQQFKLERILNQDTMHKSITLLGSLPSHASEYDNVSETVHAIIRLEKSAFPALSESLDSVLVDWLKTVEMEESTDIYTWFFGHFKEDAKRRDIKINVICPATEVHIRKYSTQEITMVTETPEIFRDVVEPFIVAFPKARTQWVTNILSGISEAHKILFNSLEFIILPDMKWDLITLSSLYLMAIVRDESVRCIRDLTSRHLPLLKKIRSEARKIVLERWGLGRGGIRLYIHYQPSYYHFHVHIVNATSPEYDGMAVGRAHLLDDIISLLELDGEVLGKMTLTYALGDQHPLYEKMVEAQDRLVEQ